MSVPTLDGLELFGAGPEMQTHDEPRASTRFTTFGDDGTGSVDGGARGRRTIVKGTHFATTPYGLALAQQALRSFHDGVTHTLLDSSGVVWTNVVMDGFATLPRVRQARGGPTTQRFTLGYGFGTLPFNPQPQPGLWFQSYRAEFLHLS